MIAPSEKHLEDWVVSNFGLFRQTYDNKSIASHQWIDRIIARQPHFATGRPDLIATIDNCLVVIELKKDAITSDTVMQCLRYQWDLYQVFSGLCLRDYPYIDYHSFSSLFRQCVRGIVVGSSIEKGLLPSIEMTSIEAITYNYLDERYWFSGWYYEGLSDWHDEQINNNFGDIFSAFVKSLGV